MRLQGSPAPRVVSISLKARSAITLGGHKPDAVIWLDEADGEWVTSTAFAQGAGALLRRLHRQASAAWRDGPPVGALAAARSSMCMTTRRRIAGASRWSRRSSRTPSKAPAQKCGGAFTDAWESSPFSDAYLAALAIDGDRRDEARPRRRPPISSASVFPRSTRSATTSGPTRMKPRTSWCISTAARRCCSTSSIATSAKATTSSGCRPITAWRRCPSASRRRASMPAASAPPRSGARSMRCSRASLGGGTYRTRVIYTEIYFNEGVYARLLQNPKAMEAVLDTVRKTEGVWRVYRKEELSGDRSADARAGVEPLRRPQRRHQDSRREPTGSPQRARPRTAPAIATTRACRVCCLASGSRGGNTSSRQRRSTSRRRWRS